MPSSLPPWGMPQASPSDHDFCEDRLSRLDSWMTGWVESGKLPGLTVVIARQGSVIHAHQVGFQDKESGTELRPDTVHRMYSMTKPVTGVALMTLLEDGLCLLDDPVSGILPEFEGVGVLSGGGLTGVETTPAKPITLRHLATHTAGLSYHFYPHEPVSLLYREAGVTGGLPTAEQASLAQWCEDLAKLPLRSQPGERWHYSVGMDVLGRVVEVLTGKRFGDYLEERIFEPLGMKDSGFRVRDDQVERFASSYGRNADGTLHRIETSLESPYREPPRIDFGGSGLVSTAGDYLRFAQMLLGGGELEGKRILSPASVELMTADHLPAIGALEGPSSLASMRWFKGAGFGLTGMVVTDPVRNGVPGSVGEFGWGGAASTNFWIDPLEELAVVLLTQFIPSGTYPLRPQIRSMVYQALIG